MDEAGGPAGDSGPRLPPLPPPPPPPLPPPRQGGPATQAALEVPPVSEAVLAIPLRTRDLLRQSLDLQTRGDTGLRSASFYIGFMLLVTVAPAMILLGLALTMSPALDLEAGDQGAWLGWLALAMLPAALGYVAAGTEARALATAVLGGRAEGRPLRLRQSIAVARRTFWRILGAQLLVGFAVAVASGVLQVILLLVVGPADQLGTGVSFVASLVVSVPFVYVPAAVVLGEVGVFESLTRSIRLGRLRKRLALVVALFSVLGQFIVLFGISAGADLVARLVAGSGLDSDFPPVLVVPIAAAMTFAFGTLTFLVEAIAAAPAVHAFEALTHYTRGLDVGRREPVRGNRVWDPWVTPGLAACGALALLALLGGVLTYPG